MELRHAMSTLRAVRRLLPDPIPEEVLQRVLEAATWAPSGGNVQPWRIVVVRDPAVKRRLRDLYLPEWQRFAAGYRKRAQSLSEEARAREERTVSAGDRLAERFHDAPAILIFCFQPSMMAITDSHLDRPSVVGGGSVYPAVQNALLAARAEGLGCTLTTLLCLREPEVRELLSIPDGWYTCAAVPLGYPVGGGHGPIRRRPPTELCWNDRWGQPWSTSEPHPTSPAQS